MIVIQDDAFVGPVTWGMFWEWVSTEAARALRELEHEESKKLSEPVADESLVLKAQVEFLVNNGHLTAGDAFQLREQLVSNDLTLKESARRTIAAMHEGLSDGALNQNLVCDGFGFAGGDTMNASADELEKERVTTGACASKATATNDDTKRFSEPDKRFDVMCSLMSTQGLQRLLQRQNILVKNDAPVRHEDLHCLALMAAAPASSTPEPSS
ncbi:unnamed protein product [Peronospora destructor]|uniref:Uncharacterized protein n=1 Tax=Peronospora destructor TaxID=86335 RepID=A0AAV0VH34_9STRA|nr:unnamed protein product [Peronospora destructor]